MITTAEQAAIYARRIMDLEKLLRDILTAYDTPHYGDHEAQLDRLFVAVEQARRFLC